MARLTSVFCFLIIQALVLNNNAVSASVCRPGWEEFNGACYSFSQIQASYADAVALCDGHQAKLVQIETTQENHFVVEMAKRKNVEFVWIGGSDMFNEGTWEWIFSGKLINSAFSYWKPGEPSETSNVEECAHMWKSYGYA